MTLRQLEILRAVLRFQTTMAAARVLGMSQPAVSAALKQMESQLGFALFERVNNRLFPTEAARMLQQEAEPLFTIHTALEQKLQDLRDDTITRLRILSTPPLGHHALPRALDLFLRHNPRVRIFFDVRDLDEIQRQIEAGATDLGFGLSLEHRPGLMAQPLLEDRMVCVCRPEHPLAALPVVRPADLAAHPFIALEAGRRMGAAVRQAFLEARQPFLFRAEVRYADTACALAAAGLGASVVDPFSPRRAPRELAVRPFEPAIPSIAYAFWSGRTELPRTARRFLAETTDVIRRSLNQAQV